MLQVFLKIPEFASSFPCFFRNSFVVGSEGYPEPMFPYSFLIFSTSFSRVAFASIEPAAAET